MDVSVSTKREADGEGQVRRRLLPVSVTSDSDDEEISQELRAKALDGEDTDSACEDIIDDDQCFDDQEIKPLIPQNVLDLADGALSRLPPRWRNWLTRIFSGLCLISGFSILVGLGPAGLMFLTYLVLYTSLNEVLRLGKNVCNVFDGQTINLCWTIVGVLEYYLVGPGILRNLMDFSRKNQLNLLVKVARPLERQHEALCFTLYLTCLVYFVLTVHRKEILRRYALLAWTHMAAMLLCIPGHLMNLATFSGMIWYVVPMSVITINDIAAYMVGFFFGKTPLIKLSPKKTREGFIGGGILTILFGTIFSLWVSQYPSLICPVEVSSPFVLTVTDCKVPSLFETYPIQIFGGITVHINDFLFHGFFISLFSSLVGPVGGFFASGFKRACKRKNFGSVIPGHGGVLDRCDCMFLMALFISVYKNALQAENIF